MPVLPFIPLILSGVGAIGGALGNKQSARTGTQSTTSTPSLLPGQQDFLNSITSKYSNLLSKDPNMSGYEAQGIQNINQNAAIGAKAAENYATVRGINGPAALTPQLMNDNARIGQISQFSNSIPLLARQQMMQTLGQAGNFSSSLVHGNNTDTTTVNPGSAAAGGIGNISSLLSYFAGKGNLFPSSAPKFSGSLPGEVTAGDSGGAY